MQSFYGACIVGDLQGAMSLYQLCGVDIHANDDLAFRLACWRGHLAVAQWLLGLGVDIHSTDDWAFRLACESGQLVVAKWLVGMGGVDIHALHDGALRCACDKGHLGLGRWLVALDPSGVWPSKDMKALQAWSHPRDAWMRAVLSHSPRSRKWRW
jgi:hypothetical protein